MEKIKITFSDGTEKEYPKFTTYEQISKDYKSNNPILCAKVKNRMVNLSDKAEYSCKVDFLDLTSANGNRAYVSGLKMLFEYAAKELNSKAKVNYLYSLSRGLIAEVKNAGKIDEEYVAKLSTKMKEVVKKGMPIEKMIVKNADAINFYDELGEQIKADNIRNIVDPTVVLYRLDNLINYYYYEMPNTTSVINTYEIKYVKNSLILINYPNEFDNGVLPVVKEQRELINTYTKGKNWLATMKKPYIKDINNEITSGHIESFVRSSELNFNLEINETAKKVCEDKNIKFVMIAGPSSSGKTTVTKRIANYFEIYGKDPIVISVDDYYKERVDTPKDENGEYDFECLEAIDLDYLAKDVIDLLSNKEVTLPRFNFITGCKEMTSKKIKLKENSIVLFEGLHAINDDLLPMISSEMKFKIYVSPLIPLCVDEHNFISSKNVRLLRRIVRDFRTRGYNIESTIKNNYKVRAGEEKHITPFIPSVDKIINTSLPYEIGALKVIVEPLLFSVPMTSEYYTEARRLLSFLKQFFTINLEFIPKDSILREFIGGNDD